MKKALAPAAVLWLLSPAAAHACAVCFGQPQQSGLFRGLGWGLVVLLGFTFSILGALAWTMWRIERNRAASEARSA
ncbi:MAG: hypothetical protein HY921_01330 [Elusimicrobia bacterium]|nr:hypothetical protein [Elusimicrobiota bacterium]